jgi:hypothetical protein
VLVDQFSDTQSRILYQISQEYPEALQRVKHASVDAVDLPSSAYAYPEVRRFPMHTPEHAVLSRVYAEKQASAVPKHVMDRLDKALGLFGVDMSQTFATTKVAHEQEDLSSYLLPQYRALVVKTAEHVPVVAEAILQQRHKMNVDTVVVACTELIKRAAALGVDSEDIPSDIFKYAGLTSCDAGVLLDWVETRIGVAPGKAASDAYAKIAQVITAQFPASGTIQNRDDLIKIACVIEKLDKDCDLFVRYGNTLLDPMETVFNMDKIASMPFTLAGEQVDEARLLNVLSNSALLEDLLGPDFAAEVKAEDGSIDPNIMKQVLSTLPADTQAQLMVHVKAYL